MNATPDNSNPWLRLIRWGIAVIVAAAIGYTVWKAASQLTEQQFRFSDVDYRWWPAAIASYVVSILLSGCFWHRVLVAMQQGPTLSRSLAAFCISQLGKYVPGKAMVIVMRTDHIRGPDVAIGPAIASVFVETFTWLFTGSAIASAMLIFMFDQPALRAVAAVMTIVAGFLAAPPTIRWMANRMGHVKGKKTGKLMSGLTPKAMAPGWGLLTIGWLVNGLSLWLVLKGLPEVSPTPGDFWLALTCVTLSTAAGFASLLPGGLGVRELVMIPLLSMRFDAAIVVVAAIAIRLVWLCAELLTAAIAYAVSNGKPAG